MKAEQQYIDLFTQCEALICRHSAEGLNAPRAKAFADLNGWVFLRVSRKNTNIRRLGSILLRISD